MTPLDAMKQALVELCNQRDAWYNTDIPTELTSAITNLRAAIKAMEDAEPVVITTGMVYAFHNALTDGAISSDDFEEIKTGLKAALANVTHPAPAVPSLTGKYPLRKYINAAQIGANDSPHIVVEKLEKAILEAPAVPEIKGHQIAALVNELRDIAIKYHDHQSLRERLAGPVHDLWKGKYDAPAVPSQEPVGFDEWFYEWRKSTWHPLPSDPRKEMPSHWYTSPEYHMRIAWNACLSSHPAPAVPEGLLTEVHLINDAFHRILAERTFAADDIEYDLFSAGWKACAELVKNT